MQFEAIPNEVRNRLALTAKVMDDVSSNMGASRVESWPGFDGKNQGTHARKCIVKMTLKWDAKFNYNDAEGKPVEAEAWSIKYSYQCFGGLDEGKECDGNEHIIPYDISALPEVEASATTKKSKQQTRAKMSLGRVATNFRNILGIDEGAFKALTTSDAGILTALEKVGAVFQKSHDSGTQLMANVNFQIRKEKYKDRNNNEVETWRGDDVITSLTGGT